MKTLSIAVLLFLILPCKSAEAAQIQTHLLVINRPNIGNGALIDYSLSNGRRSVISQLSGTGWALAVQGDTVYVQTVDADAGAVTAYDAIGGSVRGQITTSAFPTYWMAIDTHGTLYVPTEISAAVPVIQQYTAGSLTLTGTIRDGIVAPRTILIDRSDTLYVANAGTQSSIQIYPYGISAPTLAIDHGIGVPEDIALGQDGSLYVAATQGWSLKEYAPGTDRLLREISETGEPQRLAVSPSGLVAVQCDDNNGSNFIDVYAAHFAKRLGRIVPHPGDRFGAMAFDKRDTLYTGEEIPAKSAHTYTEIAQYSASGQRQRVLGNEDGVVNFALDEREVASLTCPSHGHAWGC